MALLDRVRKYADEHQLWSPASRLITAVSGGSDSVAMLLILRELASQGAMCLCGIAHLDHRIRGDESRADAAFCQALGDRLGIPVVIAEEDVPALAEREGLSL